MTLLLSVISVAAGALLSYAQTTRRGLLRVLATLGQIGGLVVFYLQLEDHYQSLGFFVLGALLGAAVGSREVRGRSSAP